MMMNTTYFTYPSLFIIFFFIFIFSLIIWKQKLNYKKQLNDLKLQIEKEQKNTSVAYDLCNDLTRENINLKQQLDNFEKEEDNLIKNISTKNWNIKRECTNMYIGKKAIIGNYSTFMAEQTRHILESFGMSVETVKSGIDLYDRIIHDGHYDIIFTNHIYQQGFDGKELLKKLKLLDNFNTPVVIHTISRNQRKYFIDEVGFDEYIEKPIQYEEIERVLKKFF